MMAHPRPRRRLGRHSRKVRTGTGTAVVNRGSRAHDGRRRNRAKKYVPVPVHVPVSGSCGCRSRCGRCGSCGSLDNLLLLMAGFHMAVSL